MSEKGKLQQKYTQYAFYKNEEMGIHTYKHIVVVAI